MEELLAKYFSGETSEKEKEEIEQWRGASEENARSFLAYKKAWIESNIDQPPDQSVFSAIMGEGEDNTEENSPVKVVPLWNQKLFRIAAMLIVAIGLIFTILTVTSEQPYGQLLAEKTTFSLPDGSKVTVQRGGILTIGAFEETREVTLSGKAYFEVDRDKNRPFIVKTRGALVEVTGTSFVVKSYEDTPVTEVMVNSGSVSLSQNPEVFSGQSLKIKLERGEMGELEIGKRGIRKRKINDENYLAWKTEIITFRRSSLREVSSVIEDVYNVKLAFDNPALQNCKLTASFKEKSADEVVGIIAETFKLQLDQNGSTYTLAGESCN